MRRGMNAAWWNTTAKTLRSFALWVTVATLLLGGAIAGEAKTWTVTTTEDSSINAGALRYVLANAGDGDTVKFSCAGSNLTSRLILRKSVTIEGPATIKQTGNATIFLVQQDDIKVTLKKLTLTGGGKLMSHGGALLNYGTLKMEECVVSGNTASLQGGAILNAATLTMKKCTVSENTSAEGGGIINFDSLAMEDCTIRNNAASGEGGGIYNSGTLSMKNCTIENNKAASSGALYNFFDRTLKMEGCTVASNTTGGDGGGIGNSGKLEMKKCSITNNTSGGKGGGIYITPGQYSSYGTLTAKGCTITGNKAKLSGGGIYNSTTRENCTLKDKTTVKNNTPDQIVGPYTADNNCEIGNSPNKSATAFAGYAGDAEPQPRSITDDPDVTAVENALTNSGSTLFRAIEETLSGDLGGTSGDVTAALSGLTASLYYANTFEDVALEGNDLVVEYTASWPERVRYYSLFARADGSGYESPERGVQFEIKPGQDLPEDVTPPDFYEEGEGLMTWRNVVTDGGSFDLNPVAGVVTFRVCSVRAAVAVGDTGSGGGCNVGAVGGTAPTLPLTLLLGIPFLATRSDFCGRRRQKPRCQSRRGH